MNECPYCHATKRQIKAGKNDSGSQRYWCRLCNRRYTPEPFEHGYPEQMRQQAVKMYADGISFRRIARHLGIDHVSVMNWVKAHTEDLPAATLPEEHPLHIVEMDELHTFIGAKKSKSIS
jgi:transposase-like protein